MKSKLQKPMAQLKQKRTAFKQIEQQYTQKKQRYESTNAKIDAELGQLRTSTKKMNIMNYELDILKRKFERLNEEVFEVVLADFSRRSSEEGRRSSRHLSMRRTRTGFRRW